MPPLAVKLTGAPEQTVISVGETAMVGIAIAFTATVLVPEQVPSEATTV